MDEPSKYREEVGRRMPCPQKTIHTTSWSFPPGMTERWGGVVVGPTCDLVGNVEPQVSVLNLLNQDLHF